MFMEQKIWSEKGECGSYSMYSILISWIEDLYHSIINDPPFMSCVFSRNNWHQISVFHSQPCHRCQSNPTTHTNTQFLCDPLTCDVSQSLYVFSTYFIISPRPPGEMDQTALHCLTPPSHEPDCPRHQNHSFIFVNLFLLTSLGFTSI